MGTLGCAELAERGLLDGAACCEACHSAEGYAPGFVLGPCRVVLPGGGVAFVCCSSRGHLAESTSGARVQTQRR